MKEIKSKHKVPIRLTNERWLHITEEHPEMAGYYYEVLETIQDPEAIYKGNHEECIAVKQTELGKYIVVIYKEINNKDGFVITAFLTRKIKKLERRIKIWPI